jgi:hypothetical protein
MSGSAFLRAFGLALFLLALVGAAAGEAQAAQRKFAIFNFDSVLINGPISVSITTGVPIGVTGTAATPAQLSELVVRNAGSMLIVEMRNQRRGAKSSSEPIAVQINARLLTKLTLNGDGKVTVNRLRGEDVRLRLNGYGALAIDDLTATKLTVDMFGGGQIQIAGGMAGSAQVGLLGNSIFAADAVTAQTLALSQRGAASSALHVIRSAQIDNSGAGSIAISGPAVCEIRSAGAATVQCGT